MNVPATPIQNWWDANTPRYTHWDVSTRPENPYRNIAAKVISEMVHEVHVNLDVDPALVMMTTLPSVSLACSGLVDVVAPTEKCGPTVVYTLGVAEKANGKSLIHDVICSKPLGNLQSEYLEDNQTAIEQHEKDTVVWGVTLRALQQSMAKKVRDGEDPSAEEEVLRDHLERRPKSPRCGPFLLEDTTSAAFYYAAYKNGVSIKLGGAEGGTLFLGDALNEPQKFNAFFSGEDVRIDRRTAPSFTISNVRVTIGILVQPPVLKSFNESKRGVKAAATGLNSRLLVCDSTAYKRHANSLITQKTWKATERFHARLVAFMKRTLMSAHIDGFQRQELRFTTEAAVRWAEVRSRIECCREVGGMYEFAQDHAGRLPEIIARIAALFHFFEEKIGDIGVETLEAAISIAYLSSIDYLKLFVPPPREYTDALLLDEHFEKHRIHGQLLFDKSYARACCPNALRTEGRYDLAMSLLLKQGKICYGHDMHGYPCLQIVPPQPYVIQQVAYGRKVGNQRVLL